MHAKNVKNLILFSLVCLIFAGCSKSDDQRRFENEAFREPQGITEMAADGRPIANGNVDPDDWRIGPMFQGSIQIEAPAYPNPVISGTRQQIDIYFSGLLTFNTIEGYAFEYPTDNPVLIFQEQVPDRSLLTINYDSGLITGGDVQPEKMYRVLIFDGNNNLITYGDVRVD